MKWLAFPKFQLVGGVVAIVEGGAYIGVNMLTFNISITHVCILTQKLCFQIRFQLNAELSYKKSTIKTFWRDFVLKNQAF